MKKTSLLFAVTMASIFASCKNDGLYDNLSATDRQYVNTKGEYIENIIELSQFGIFHDHQNRLLHGQPYTFKTEDSIKTSELNKIKEQFSNLIVTRDTIIKGQNGLPDRRERDLSILTPEHKVPWLLAKW